MVMYAIARDRSFGPPKTTHHSLIGQFCSPSGLPPLTSPGK